jgi:hypothetical protein
MIERTLKKKTTTKKTTKIAFVKNKHNYDHYYLFSFELFLAVQFKLLQHFSFALDN